MNSTRSRDALSGAAAAGLALGVSELIAGLVTGLPSLIEALGNWVIDVSPKPLKDFAIEVFGTNDKLVLLVSIAVVTLLLGAVVGVFARKRFGIAVVVFIGFAVVAALAAARDPQMSLALAIIPAGAGAITGLGILQWLYGLGMPTVQPSDTEEVSEPGWSRRSFLMGTAAVFGIAAISAATGRWLLESAKKAVAGRNEVALPSPADALPSVPPAANLEVEGLSPIIVPNDDFYRIDTAFAVPTIVLQDWTLTIRGRVDPP